MLISHWRMTQNLCRFRNCRFHITEWPSFSVKLTQIGGDILSVLISICQSPFMAYENNIQPNVNPIQRIGEIGKQEQIVAHGWPFNTLKPRQNGRHIADDTFKRIFVNENIRILIEISLRFVPKCPIKNTPALVQIMAWRRPGDKPLSEPMMVSLPMHICVTRPQWVNSLSTGRCDHNFDV